LAAGHEERGTCENDETDKGRVIRRERDDGGAHECGDGLKNEAEAEQGREESVVCHK
jgi:hypothetical protein